MRSELPKFGEINDFPSLSAIFATKTKIIHAIAMERLLRVSQYYPRDVVSAVYKVIGVLIWILMI